MRIAAILGVIVIGAMLAGCASHEVKALSPEPIENYKNRVTENGVTIAAQPFSTKETAEAVFTIDLTAAGYCPILLVMNNESADSQLVMKADIELIDSAGNVRKPVPANVVVEKFKHNKMAYELGFGIFSYTSADDANKKMVGDLSNKELPAEKVLLQNRKTYGALYFDLGPGLKTLPNATLIVPIHNMKSGQTKQIKVRMAEDLPLPQVQQESEQ